MYPEEEGNMSRERVRVAPCVIALASSGQVLSPEQSAGPGDTNTTTNKRCSRREWKAREMAG